MTQRGGRAIDHWFERSYPYVGDAAAVECALVANSFGRGSALPNSSRHVIGTVPSEVRLSDVAAEGREWTR
eukprot:6361866-Amphidinium_carterae.1